MGASIVRQIEASAYLSRLRSEASDLQGLDSLDDNSLTYARLDTKLSELCSALEVLQVDELSAAESALIQYKTDFNYVWSLAELSRLHSQPELGAWQTRFAEVSIGFALRLAWLTIAPKQKAITTMVQDCLGRVPGLFVFGMGKLGGSDLNFSSDVDLVAYFDPDVLQVPEVLGKSYVCHQVLQTMTKLLNQGGASNFIWRVDWRLRPNASATTLAMSVDAAQDYYFYRASPWHRLALMKARVIAGDIALGEQFKSTLTPFTH